MAETIEKSLLDLDFASLSRRTFTQSPAAWEDQVVYFLLLDRFSDGNERGGHRDNEDRPASGGTTPTYRPDDPGRVDYETWFRAGSGWQGGTLPLSRRIRDYQYPEYGLWLSGASGRPSNGLLPGSGFASSAAAASAAASAASVPSTPRPATPAAAP